MKEEDVNIDEITPSLLRSVYHLFSQTRIMFSPFLFSFEDSNMHSSIKSKFLFHFIRFAYF